MSLPHVKALFLDVGGVFLTNGWGRQSRKQAAQDFHLDFDEMESRHQLTFDTFEIGKISLEEYLGRVVFYEQRPFTEAQFREFMFTQSQPITPMLELIKGLKARYGLKIVVVSNEGRELTEYRVKKFQLDEFVDFFVASSFVHLRKPDIDIYRLALDLALVDPSQVIYIDDRLMFIQVAESLGITSLHHKDFETSQKQLISWGLPI